ncbi:hypothetical protein BDR22DRAFT_826823 [Usnea florida]
MTTFPFFRLPPEVRNMIYRLLFETAHKDKIVTPDPAGSRRQNNLGQRTLNLSDSLPLLRTCRMVHREATAVLYGSNVFRFDDHPHNDDKHTIPGFNMSLPCCDLLTMYCFLVCIGKDNREKLQHIHLDFSDKSFIVYPEEPSTLRLYRNAGASFVGDAVDLLAASHHLKTFSVSFRSAGSPSNDNEPIPSDGLQNFFCLLCIYEKLARKISTIRGIEQFRCLIGCEGCDEDLKFDVWSERKINEMKAIMEVRNPQPPN